MNAIYALIPIVSIAGGLAIAAIAIITDHRRKEAILEERRLMIEKGMTPPPLDNSMLEKSDPAGTRSSVEGSLRTGVVSVFVGLGLIAAYLVIRYLLIQPMGGFFRLTNLLAPAGALVSLIGLGNLVYYWIARRRISPAA